MPKLEDILEDSDEEPEPDAVMATPTSARWRSA